MLKTIFVVALIAILFCYSTTVSAQTINYEPEFGKIQKKDLARTAFEQYPGEEAVILFDYGVTVILDKSARYKRHKRIKILTKDGYQWGNGMIPLFQTGGREKLIAFEAATYNLVDDKIQVSPLQETSAFKNEVNDDINLMRFALPDVREGSIVEIYYEVSHTGFVDWQFQENIPTLVSNYKISVILGVEFDFVIQGYRRPEVTNDFDYHEGKECRMVNLVMKDVPAFESETFITNPRDYISRARFYITTIKLEVDKYVLFWTSYIKQWTDVPRAYNYHQFTDGYVNNILFLSDITATVIKSCETNEEKVVAIHDYVRSHYNWNHKNRIYSANLRKAHAAKEGSAADINLTLLAMLRYAGVMGEPVLISTKDHGMLRPDMPSMDQFNRVIVQTSMNGRSVFLDATDKYLPYDYLPLPCSTLLGYVASETHQGWVELHELSKTTVSVTADLTVTAEGKLAGTVTVEKNGHEAATGRHDYKELGADGFASKHLKTDGVGIKEAVFASPENLLEKFKESYTIEIDADENTGAQGTLYLNPLLMGRVYENPYREAERKYPLDLGFAKVVNYHAKIKLPQGYRVDEIPQAKLVMLPGDAGKFLYNAASSNATEIALTYQLAINKSYFLQNEYPDLREFMNVVMAKQTEQIVIRKAQ